MLLFHTSGITTGDKTMTKDDKIIWVICSNEYDFIAWRSQDFTSRAEAIKHAKLNADLYKTRR